LLAPGQRINSSIPGGGFTILDGTSMATPHVAGAWAVLKSMLPSASVDQILAAFTSTGVSIYDSRNGITKPRIRVDAAVNALCPALTTSIFPSGSGSLVVNTAPNCGSNYSPGTDVSITASPSGSNLFYVWGGSDTWHSNPVTITLNSSKTVTAIFVTPTNKVFSFPFILR
jgi:subtilisin family serine protease